MKTVLAFVLCCLTSIPALAQSRDSERIRVLEVQVQQLQSSMSQLHQRLSSLEGSTRPPAPQPIAQEFSCMIQDSGYSRVFLGKGRLRLEAEAAARQACGSAVNPSYCNGAIKCSNPYEEGYRQTICLVQDTGYSRIFQGEGLSALEAEFQARKKCGDAVNPSYCRAAARCERL